MIYVRLFEDSVFKGGDVRGRCGRRGHRDGSDLLVLLMLAPGARKWLGRGLCRLRDAHAALLLLAPMVREARGVHVGASPAGQRFV